jgi:hypothetical protein
MRGVNRFLLIFVVCNVVESDRYRIGPATYVITVTQGR